ncbi:hypothetical protein BD310DRAFT_926241 [Dichomitus squalens]|uniref:Uncharacterized protein n=1 Tax=Dichomitus squalens TaxID=114155 RepID=A0A4Q9PWT0_9APHY|nr:hypothetical protein BD310DRAFT_926241 [Dichomitus squalens]
MSLLRPVPHATFGDFGCGLDPIIKTCARRASPSGQTLHFPVTLMRAMIERRHARSRPCPSTYIHLISLRRSAISQYPPFPIHQHHCSCSRP